MIPCRERKLCIHTKRVVALISVHSACPFVELVVYHSADFDECQHEYLFIVWMSIVDGKFYSLVGI